MEFGFLDREARCHRRSGDRAALAVRPRLGAPLGAGGAVSPAHTEIAGGVVPTVGDRTVLPARLCRSGLCRRRPRGEHRSHLVDRCDPAGGGGHLGGAAAWSVGTDRPVGGTDHRPARRADDHRCRSVHRFRTAGRLSVDRSRRRRPGVGHVPGTPPGAAGPGSGAGDDGDPFHRRFGGDDHHRRVERAAPTTGDLAVLGRGGAARPRTHPSGVCRLLVTAAAGRCHRIERTVVPGGADDDPRRGAAVRRTVHRDHRHRDLGGRRRRRPGACGGAVARPCRGQTDRARVGVATGGSRRETGKGWPRQLSGTGDAGEVDRCCRSGNLHVGRRSPDGG
ncbi:hypothetical protein CLV29_1463 [Naumannella halotolerans]|uniref:Uncharacterized protein n=1 Tax=Naumannella halotolerans TaxID=993414 RepID=A0A4V3ENH2_9ACTN|nr:hypothetical protein CLV29_1463 [Naumannella halotolerans]